MKDKILNFIGLFFSIIVIIMFIILIYVSYVSITGNPLIDIYKYEYGEAGYPTSQTTPAKEETYVETSNSDLFSGVNGNSTSKETGKYQNRFLYNQLDKTGKIIYDKLYENKESMKTGTYKLEFGNTFKNVLSQDNGSAELKKQYQIAIEAFLYENPDVFYLNVSNMYINIEKITKIEGIKYNVYIANGSEGSYLSEQYNTKEKIDECQKQIEQERDKILAKVEGKSDYEKIKGVHDYLVDTITYKRYIKDDAFNIYGALVLKECVCEGYAKTFQYLMNELGIDNMIAIGTGIDYDNKSETHAWNYVKLDGNWYAMDVTWDDPVADGFFILTNEYKYKYFLKGSDTFFNNHITTGQFTEDGKVFSYPTLSLKAYKKNK